HLSACLTACIVLHTLSLHDALPIFDLKKYSALETSYSETWGVLMRKDSVLADRETISPEDLRDKPLILSQQESPGGSLTQWIGRDRKSTRLNSSHVSISYAVFCLKK